MPTNRISVFSLLTLRKLHVNNHLISVKQSKREEDGNAELGFEELSVISITMKVYTEYAKNLSYMDR